MNSCVLDKPVVFDIDPFASVLGDNRGTGSKGLEHHRKIEAETNLGDAMKKMQEALVTTGTDQGMHSVLEWTMDYSTSPTYLQAISEWLVPAIIEQCAYSAEHDNAHVEFGYNCGLNGAQVIELFHDPRMHAALKKVVLNAKRYASVDGFVRAFKKAFNETLVEVASDKVCNDEKVFWNALGQDEKFIDSLPAGTPSVTKFVDVVEFAALLKVHVPRVGLTKPWSGDHNPQPVSFWVGKSQRKKNHLRHNLWPIVFKSVLAHQASK